MLAALALTGVVRAGESAQLSLDAYSGLVRTPHAATLPAGQIAFFYTNLEQAPSLPGTETYGLSLGLFERLELNARLVEGDVLLPDGVPVRDFAAGFKLLAFKRSGWPSVAFGAHDIQGNRLFPSAFAVTSWSLSSLRVSVGHGRKSETLRGTFGGIEWEPTPWLTLILEHARDHDRAAARLTAPLHRGILLSGMAATELDGDSAGDTRFGIELSLPLGGPGPQPSTKSHSDVGAQPAVAKTDPLESAPSTAGIATTALDGTDPVDTRFGTELSLPSGEPIPQPRTETHNDVAVRSAAKMSGHLESELRNAGMTATLVLQQGNTLTACVDDSLQYRAPSDALGVALAVIGRHRPLDVSHLKVVLQRQSYPLLVALASAAEPTHVLKLTYASLNACDAPVGTLVTTAPRPVEIVLEPNLVTFFGTEFGVLDADLALRLRLQFPVLRTGTLLLSVLSPSSHSSDFADGQNFERQRARPGLDQGLLQWYSRPNAFWHVLTSGGHMRLLGSDTAALQQEHVLYSSDGASSMRLNLGLYHNQKGGSGVGVVELERVFARYDTALSLAVGRFAAGDSGGRVELTRLFGDARVTLFVKAAADGNRNDAAAGMRIGIPLSGRFPGASRAWVVRGAEHWSHSMQSTLGGTTGENALRPNLLVEPLPDRNLRETYLDFGRATPAWILGHPERVQDADVVRSDAH